MNHTAFVFRLATTRRKKPAHVTPGNGKQWGRTHLEMAYVNAVREIAHLTDRVRSVHHDAGAAPPDTRLILV